MREFPRGSLEGAPYSVPYDQVNVMLLNSSSKSIAKSRNWGREWKFSRRSSKLSSANSEGERATGSQQTSAANRPEQSVKHPSQ